MSGPEHEVILKAKKVARLHNAASLERDPEIISVFVQKMEEALEELTEAVYFYESWKEELNGTKN